MANVDIVIVNWNAGKQLYDAVQAIGASKLQAHRVEQVIVVDNASQDNSLDLLNKVTNLPLKIIKNASNKGFGTACNQGAENSTADYILFVNPDARVGVDAIASLLTFMESDDVKNQKIGIVGGQLTDETGHIARSCARYITLIQVWADATGLSRLAPTHFFWFTHG